MTEAWIRSLVEAIHSSSTQTVIYLAGGASQAIAWLMSTPGASNTILEVLVPYSRTSMVQLLGKVPAQFTSQQTVEELALLAYNRALKLSKPGFPVLGVGFTGSLVSIHPKHGNHRFYLSTRTCDRLRTSNITLVKGMRTREEEDKLASHFMLKAIADACKVSASFTSDLHESEVLNEYEQSFDEDQELQQIIDGNICMKIYHFLQDAHIADTERKVILSGSFNPLHDGHVRLLEIASSICGDGLPCFEISAINADKPPLEVSEIKKRVEQFRKAGNVGFSYSYRERNKIFFSKNSRRNMRPSGLSNCDDNWEKCSVNELYSAWFVWYERINHLQNMLSPFTFFIDYHPHIAKASL